MKKTDQNSC